MLGVSHANQERRLPLMHRMEPFATSHCAGRASRRRSEVPGLTRAASPSLSRWPGQASGYGPPGRGPYSPRAALTPPFGAFAHDVYMNLRIT
jgi:hypothetical protein